MCETKPTRFETDSHFQQQERSHRRQNTEMSQHGCWERPRYPSEARHPQVNKIPRNQQFAAKSQTTQRPERDPIDMVASGCSPERELSAAPPTFYNTEPVVTSDYSLQYIGSHGNSLQYFNRSEPIRPGVPLHFPQRGEQGKRKQKEPDKYDGERVEWPDYLAHFETISKWNGWVEREKGLQLVTSLRGKAQRVLSEIPSSQREDFATLSEFLARQFNPPNRENAFPFELRQRKKLNKETLMEYGGEVLRLTQKAYPKFPHLAIDQIATDQFVKGLPDPEQKKHVDLQNPGSLDEAVSLATQYEAFEQGEGRTTGSHLAKPRSAPVNADDDNRVSCKEINQLKKQISQVEQKLETKTKCCGSRETQETTAHSQELAELTKKVEELTRLVMNGTMQSGPPQSGVTMDQNGPWPPRRF